MIARTWHRAIPTSKGSELRSLLKISFARRVDHSKSRTLCCFGFRSDTIGGNRGLGPVLHALCARSFGIGIRLKTAQLNTNNQSTFASPRSFTLVSGREPGEVPTAGLLRGRS